MCRTRLDAWFEHAVNCCAFLAWRLSTQGASIHFRSNGYEFRQPEDGDIYTILKYLALVYPQRADAPEGPLNDASYKIVFTPSPRAFRDAGWMQARLLGPDVLPVPAGGADPDSPTDDQTKPEPVRTSITVVEKISAETPANVTTLDSTALQQSPGTNLDDRLRDVPGFSLFRSVPPAWSPTPPPRASRCAASGLPAPAARSSCGMAFPPTIPSAAGSTGRSSCPTKSAAWRFRAAPPPASSATAP